MTMHAEKKEMLGEVGVLAVVLTICLAISALDSALGSHGLFALAMLVSFLLLAAIAYSVIKYGTNCGHWLIGEDKESKPIKHDIDEAEVFKNAPSNRLAWNAFWIAVDESRTRVVSEKSVKRINNLAMHNNRIIRSFEEQVKKNRKYGTQKEVAELLRNTKTRFRRSERMVKSL